MITGRILLVAVLCLTVVAAVAAPVVLEVAQTPGQMEKAIGKYLKDVHGLEFEAVPDDDGKGGLTLISSMQSDKVPDFSAFIVSMPYQQDDAGAVISSAIVMGFVSGMKVPQGKRGAVLEVMNKLNEEQDFTHLYIDKDNDIAFRWMLLVTSEGLPAEAVVEALAFMVKDWETAQPELVKALQ